MAEKIMKIINSNSKQLSANGLEIFCKTARKTVAHQGRFVVAISSGSTPRAIHRLLAQEPLLIGKAALY